VPFTNQTIVVVEHTFGLFPVVTVLDENNAVILANAITHDLTSQFTVTFALPQSGTIIATE